MRVLDVLEADVVQGGAATAFVLLDCGDAHFEMLEIVDCGCEDQDFASWWICSVMEKLAKGKALARSIKIKIVGGARRNLENAVVGWRVLLEAKGSCATCLLELRTIECARLQIWLLRQ